MPVLRVARDYARVSLFRRGPGMRGRSKTRTPFFVPKLPCSEDQLGRNSPLTHGKLRSCRRTFGRPRLSRSLQFRIGIWDTSSSNRKKTDSQVGSNLRVNYNVRMRSSTVPSFVKKAGALMGHSHAGRKRIVSEVCTPGRSRCSWVYPLLRICRRSPRSWNRAGRSRPSSQRVSRTIISSICVRASMPA